MPDSSHSPPPAEVLTSRDVELFVVGVGCFTVAGWTGLSAGVGQLLPVALFLGLGVLSFALAYWDLRTRDAGLGSRLRGFRPG